MSRLFVSYLTTARLALTPTESHDILAASLMTPNAVCPRCHEVELVRFENVIKGTQASRLFYCGGCDLEWAETVPPNPRRPRLIRQDIAQSSHARF